MKKLAKAFLVITMILIITTLYNVQTKLSKPVSSNFYLGYFSQVPPDFDELLQQTYGESPHHVFFGDIKMSIEKTVKEKYYIVYSWVNGDQSYFAINSIIEDTNKKKLQKEDFNSMYIKDDRGNTYFPLPYFSLIDFPPDQPLGWKQILYVKFYPLKEGTKTIDIYITYKGEQKIIKNVPVE